jgi:hypothetical protein
MICSKKSPLGGVRPALSHALNLCKKKFFSVCRYRRDDSITTFACFADFSQIADQSLLIAASG